MPSIMCYVHPICWTYRTHNHLPSFQTRIHDPQILSQIDASASISIFSCFDLWSL